MIISDFDSIFQLLDDSIIKIQTMMTSKYIVEIWKTVEEWENKLGLVQETLEEWIEFQKQWIYLENIFNADDI